MTQKAYTYLSPQARQGILNYKYTSGDYTYLDNFLNPFWAWVPEVFFPMWLAPNLVTFIGFMAMSSAFLLWAYNLLADDEVGDWQYLYYAATLFFYQTMDAADGKQARRTGSSSALGQLFDHGCDSMSVMFLVATQCASMKLDDQKLIIQLCAAELAFFIAQWEEHHTHVLNTAIGGLFGVTESQLMIVAIHLAAFFCPTVFDSTALGEPLGLPSLTLRDVLFYFGMAVCVGTTVLKLAQILGQFSFKKSFKMVFPVITTVLAALYMVLSTDMCTEVDGVVKCAKVPTLALGVSLGFACTQASNRMILASTGKVDYQPVWQPTLVFLTLLGLWARLSGTYSAQGLILALLLSLYTTLGHSFGVVGELCQLLDIHCFKISPKVT